MYKKVLAMVLAAVMLLSLAACGKKGNVKKTADGLVYYLGYDEIEKSSYDSPENTLDVEEIYSTIEYTEQMLYGRYWIDDFYDSVEKYAETIPMEELEYWSPYGDGEMVTEELSKLPVRIEAGVPNLYGSKIKTDRNYHWAYLTFAKPNGYYEDVLCSFTVEGNKVIFTPVDYYKEHLDENFVVTGIEYQVGEDSLEYTFSLKGPNLTLSKGDDSITIKSISFSDNGVTHNLTGYKAADSEGFENIDVILGSASGVYLNDTQGELIYNFTYDPGIRYSENGVLTLIWGEKDANGNDTLRCHQFVCFGAGNSMTLVDGDGIYYYTESYSSRELLALADELTEEEIIQAGDLSDDKLKEAVEKKENLLEDLAAAFDEAGLNVAVNTQTGEIALDSAVLFGEDESAIFEDGKVFLQKFMEIYTSVVFNEKYSGFVSRIVVEGHTDTQGSYDHNQKLSEARANSVMAYCLSAECGVDATYTEALQTMLEAVGYSYDKPIYLENGEVDMAASRRVSFRFIINFEG